VCAGRIEPHKNQLALIAAARALDVKLVLIGGAHPHHAQYAERCRSHARRANVEFLGRLPTAEAVAEVFSNAAVHVLPSWFETTGLVSLEAALAGANIVSTSRGHAHEYLQDDAWYCEPANVRSIRNAIENALDAPWRPTLRERILRDFTWKNAAQQTEKGYEAAIIGATTY
jgi:glycosyltransferase involved in cell wall biosynthesis